jgi:hypothetical protein
MLVFGHARRGERQEHGADPHRLLNLVCLCPRELAGGNQLSEDPLLYRMGDSCLANGGVLHAPALLTVPSAEPARQIVQGVF